MTLMTCTARPGASAVARPGLSTHAECLQCELLHPFPTHPVSAGLTGHHALCHCPPPAHEQSRLPDAHPRPRPGTPVAPPHSQNGVHDQLRAVGLDHGRGLLGAEHVGQVRALGRGTAGGSGGTRLTDAQSARPGYNRPDPSMVHRSAHRRSSTSPGGG